MSYPIFTNYTTTVTPRVADVWVADFPYSGSATTMQVGGSILPGVFGAGTRITGVQISGQATLGSNAASGSLYAISTLYPGTAIAGTAGQALYTALGTVAEPGTLLGKELPFASYLFFTGATLSLPATAIVSYVRMS